MKFKNIPSLLGWAFQMSQTQIIKTMSFDERTSKAFDDLAMDKRHKMAIDVLAKVDRLDKADMVCIVAFHTLAPKAIHDAAHLLPNWSRPLQLALVRRWAGDSRQSQREIAEMCGYKSRSSICEKEAIAEKILNAHYWHGCDMLEIQLLDLLEERLVC